MEKKTYSYGEVRAFAEDVEESRTIEFIASTPTKDRHRTVLNPEGWQLDNFNRNGIIGYQHNVYGGGMCSGPDPDDVIGKGFAFMEGENLIVRVTFEPADLNPLAEKVFRKVLFGSLRATSVGFAPIGKGKYGEDDQAQGRANETYYFEGQELLELSIVNIPSNPDAVGRSLREQTSNAIMFVKRALGEDYSFSDIEAMKVGDVLRMLEKGKEARAVTQNEQEKTERQVPPMQAIELHEKSIANKLRTC
jgi:hypothetical protein